MEHQLSKGKLARMLKPFNVKSENLRINDQVLKGYKFEYLENAFARYLAEKNATNAM